MEERLGVLTEGVDKNEDKHRWQSHFLFLNPSKDYEIEKNISFE